MKSRSCNFAYEKNFLHISKNLLNVVYIVSKNWYDQSARIIKITCLKSKVIIMDYNCNPIRLFWSAYKLFYWFMYLSRHTVSFFRKYLKYVNRFCEVCKIFFLHIQNYSYPDSNLISAEYINWVFINQAKVFIKKILQTSFFKVVILIVIDKLFTIV